MESLYANEDEEENRDEETEEYCTSDHQQHYQENTDEGEDGFFNIDRILMEEDLLNSTPLTEATAAEIVRKHKPQLKTEQRRFITDKLLSMQTGEVLPRGSQARIAREVGVHRSTISRIFKHAATQLRQGGMIDVRSKKWGRVGRKRKQYSEQWLQSVPLHLRTTERSFAGALKIASSSVHRLKKQGLLRSHTSNNHPGLSANHKLQRMKWVLSHILPGCSTIEPTFEDMFNVVHIDEKWFYLHPEMRRFYLLPKEDDPYRCTQSKRYKIKAMFMGVIARPMYDTNGTLIDDGKYGIFPFIYHQRAKKNSKNRQAGTIETKATQNISKEVIRDMLVHKVIPAVTAKWPESRSKHILIQWDNARPHQIPRDEEFMQITNANGFNIEMVFQPPQSPDLNVLDLGLFRAIQSLQYKSFPSTLDELIDKVEEAYDSFDPLVNKYTWLTLQYIMVEILKVYGGNNYKVPHQGKRTLDSLGLLPDNVQVDQQLIDQSVQYLNSIFRHGTQQRQEQDGHGEVDAD